MIAPPTPLGPEHECGPFDCGAPSLNDWLKRRALANQRSGASRTFVVTDTKGAVIGYYALASGAVAHAEAPSAIRRNMPEPIPVMVLARLAVDCGQQGSKLGASLLKDAVLRCLVVAEHAGVRALLVHALNERAGAFYRHYGFLESPINPLVLMLRLPLPNHH